MLIPGHHAWSHRPCPALPPLFQVLQELYGPVRERLDAELAFFDTVTAVSGKLYPVPKVGLGLLGWLRVMNKWAVCVHAVPASSCHPRHTLTWLSTHLLHVQDERKAAAVGFLREVGPPPRPDLYIPTNPDCRVLSVIPESGAPMQASVAGVGIGCGTANAAAVHERQRLAEL